MGRESHNSYQPSSDPRFWFNAALDDAGLSPNEFRVYLHFVRLAGENGGVIESGARAVASTCRMSRGAAANAINALIKRRAIERTNSMPGSRRPDRYALVSRPSPGRDELFPEEHVHQADVSRPPRDREGAHVHHMDASRPPGDRANIDKNKEEETDRARARVRVRESSALSLKPKKEELSFFVTSLGLTQEDADDLWDRWLINGFRTKTGPIKDWQASCRTYKRNRWFPSQQAQPRPPPPAAKKDLPPQNNPRKYTPPKVYNPDEQPKPES